MDIKVGDWVKYKRGRLASWWLTHRMRLDEITDIDEFDQKAWVMVGREWIEVERILEVRSAPEPKQP